MSSTADEVKQRDMLGAVATIFRAAGWPLVVDLHANRANPKQVSGPDFMMLNEGTRLVVKVLGSKGRLSAAQEKIRKDYEAAGFVYVIYRPEDMGVAASDAGFALK